MSWGVSYVIANNSHRHMYVHGDNCMVAISVLTLFWSNSSANESLEYSLSVGIPRVFASWFRVNRIHTSSEDRHSSNKSVANSRQRSEISSYSVYTEKQLRCFCLINISETNTGQNIISILPIDNGNYRYLTSY